MTTRIRSGILALNASLSQVVADMYLPAMPAIALALGVSNDRIQYSVSVFLFGVALAQCLGGVGSDWLGRQWLNRLGFFCMLLGLYCCAHLQDFTWLCIGRGLSGLGAGLVTTLFYASARDQCPKDGDLIKLGSYAAMIRVFILAWVPLIGSFWLHHFGWPAIFHCLFAYTALFLLANLYFIPETRQHVPTISGLPAVLRHRQIWGAALITASLYGAIIAWVALGPILLQHHLGWQPSEYARTYVFTGAAFMLSTWGSAQYANRLSTTRLLRVVACISGITLACLLWFVSQTGLSGTLLVSSAVLMLGIAGWVFPRMMALALQPFPAFAGSISAFYLTLRALGGMGTSAWIAHFNDQNGISYVSILSLCFVLACFGHRLLKSDLQDSASPH